MTGKQRLSATVDADLLEAAERAAQRGDAKTISAWVNDALRLKLEHDHKLEALAAFVAEREAELAEITDEEIARAVRSAAERAVVVRGPKRRTRAPRA